PIRIRRRRCAGDTRFAGFLKAADTPSPAEGPRGLTRLLCAKRHMPGWLATAWPYWPRAYHSCSRGRWSPGSATTARPCAASPRPSPAGGRRGWAPPPRRAAAGGSSLPPPLFSFEIDEPGAFYSLGLYVLAGSVISGLTESLHRSRRRIAASERRYAVTLASIGDAVIATDTQARVTFLNPAAEALTGWTLADAVGRPLAEVFRIVNEETRQPVEDPAAKVLRTGTMVGLANHTALVARDDREAPIDDCGAPIIDERGAIAGVVLVFRDVTQRRQAEE